MLKSLTRKFFSTDSGGNSAEGQSNKRRDDYIMVVRQNNAAKNLEIQEVDPSLCQTLGYGPEELKKLGLGGILPIHTNELIADYLEYGSEGNDLSAVLSKVRDFSLVARNGRSVPLILRILPTTSPDLNPMFCLLFRSAGLQKTLDSGRDEIYRALRKNLVDGEAGTLPQSETLIKDLRTVISFMKEGKGTASIAVIALKDLAGVEAKYGAPAMTKALHEIAVICKNNFRDEDIIAQVSAGKIAVVLLEANLESSKTPVNRLHWKINAHEIEADGRKFKVAAVIGCTEIDRNDTPELVLSRCERAMTGDEIPGVTVLN